MKQVLCAHFPHWPIERLCRRKREYQHKPLVLVETRGNRQIVVHASREAGGIVPGMTLTEAQARRPLVHLPAQPADDLRGLEAVGRWMMRFSPAISLAPPAAIFLDATGMERLFGEGCASRGLGNFHRRVTTALTNLRMTVKAVIAPTPAAAWALAAFAPNPPPIVPESEVQRALSPLPPRSLRLDEQTTAKLAALGINTVGQLLQLRRDDLAVRFGPVLLNRIDQATGTLPEPLIFLEHRAPIVHRLDFDGPIESLEAVHWALRELATEAARSLTAQGLGARELQLTLTCPYLPPIEKTIGLMRPCRDGAAMFKLLCYSLETMDQGGDGFTAIALRVRSSQRLGHEQVALLDGEAEKNDRELDHLIERLRARLDDPIQWGELVQSNLPECASRRRSELPLTPSPCTQGEGWGGGSVRPLCLLSQPRPIKVIVAPSESRDGRPISFTDNGAVHRLAHVRGPERITGQWWLGRLKIRDYFDALDTAGQRYWLFRVAQNGLWFLHGIFE